MHHYIFIVFVEHKDDLTTEVMTDIKNQMVDNINGLKSVTEFWARGNYYPCEQDFFLSL